MANDIVMAARNYEQVLQGKYPAKAHAKKVAQWILEKGGDKKGTVYLEAQKSRYLEVCDYFLLRGFLVSHGGSDQERGI